MMKTHWRKQPNGTLAPEDAGTLEWLKKIKIGDVVGAEFRRTRNYRFHCKFFSLLQYAFDVWEPGEGLPEKNFKRFRKDMTIAAGYYTLVPNIRGELRAEADSISFGSMDADTFEELYEAVVKALLKWVLKNYTREDVDRVMQNIMEYAA